MSIIDRLLGLRPRSKEIAKERLKFVLIYDRVKLSPQLMQVLKNEIISGISKHLEIDELGMEVTLARGKRYSRLVADIPIVGIRGQKGRRPGAHQ